LEKEFRADYRGFAKLQQFHEYLVETGLLKKAEPARA
jgi:hypothetical protein